MIPSDLVFDTHAIGCLENPNLRKEIVEYIERECHNLIFPSLKSEFRVHISSFPNVVASLKGRLRGKFIPDETPTERVPEELIEILRKNHANENDLRIAEVAFKRVRKVQRRAVIVSNDPCFHQSLSELRKYDIDCIRVDNFLDYVHET